MHWSWEDSHLNNISSKSQLRSCSTGRLPFRFYLAPCFCRYTRRSLLNGGICKLPSRVASSIGYTGRRYFATLPSLPKPIPTMTHCYQLRSHKQMLWGSFRSRPISEARDVGVQACARSQIKGRSRRELPERRACRSRPPGDNIPCEHLALLLPFCYDAAREQPLQLHQKFTARIWQ